MVIKLRLKVRQLADGRFVVRYYWHWWESAHREYFDNLDAVSKFVANLVTKTKWK